MANLAFYKGNSTLYPQYSQLNNLTNANYSVARAYYNQRQLAFEKAFLVDATNAMQEFTQLITKKSQEFTKYILGNVHSVLNGGEINFKGNDRGAAVYEPYIKDILQFAHNHWEVNRYAGIPMEYFMADNATSSSGLKKILNYRDATIDNMFQQVGKLSNVAATTMKKGETRTDVAFSKNKIGENTQLELTGYIDLEDLSSALTEEDLYAELIEKMQNTGNPDLTIYGFQVKTYRDLNDRRWMNSAALADRLTSLSELFGGHYTWSSNYAALYPTYYLSKYIINILNPVNIGLITQQGLLWMTSFLDHYRLYMEVTYNSPTNPKPSNADRGGGLEIRPILYGNTVLIHKINSSEQGLYATGRMRQSSQHGANKKIKVFSIYPLQ